MVEKELPKSKFIRKKKIKVDELIGFGIILLVVGIFSIFVAVECIDGNTYHMTLLDIYDNGDGLWVDEDSGELKISDTEGYQIGETYEIDEEIDIIWVYIIAIAGLFCCILGSYMIWAFIEIT